MSEPLTLVQLIHSLLDQAAEDPGFTREDAGALTEIERRLAAARRYGGTEAHQIFSLLDTGEPISWVRDDEAPRLWFQGQEDALPDATERAIQRGLGE